MLELNFKKADGLGMSQVFGNIQKGCRLKGSLFHHVTTSWHIEIQVCKHEKHSSSKTEKNNGSKVGNIQKGCRLKGSLFHQITTSWHIEIQVCKHEKHNCSKTEKNNGYKVRNLPRFLKFESYVQIKRLMYLSLLSCADFDVCDDLIFGTPYFAPCFLQPVFSELQNVLSTTLKKVRSTT